MKDKRMADLAVIHIAKKQIGLAEDQYRSQIMQISGGITDSAGKLTEDGRKQLIAHLAKLGYHEVAKPAAKRLFPNTPAWNKIWSLWMQLADAGKVQNRSGKALLAFCTSTTKVDSVAWMESKHLAAITEALKSWLAR